MKRINVSYTILDTIVVNDDANDDSIYKAIIDNLQIVYGINSYDVNDIEWFEEKK